MPQLPRFPFMSHKSSIKDVSTFTCALLQKEEGCSQLVGQESVVVTMCQCGNQGSQGDNKESQGDHRGSQGGHSSGLGWQLVVLVAVASAALVTIVLISQQLVLRHLGGGGAGGGAGDTVTMQITIPDQGWMSSEGGWSIHSSFSLRPLASLTQ